jgi:hypothetical protein
MKRSPPLYQITQFKEKAHHHFQDKKTQYKEKAHHDFKDHSIQCKKTKKTVRL